MAAPASNRYLQYLPAIFQRKPTDETEPTLGQFLAPFEDQFAAFEQILAEVDHNFSASLASADDFLPWLAGWVAQLLDEKWDEDRRRRFLAAAMELFRWRGTVGGLKRYLDLCLDLRPDEVDIRDARWRGGMQIGVASRIGYVVKGRPDETGHNIGRNPAVDQFSHDYYVVDTVAPTDLPAGIAGEQIPAGERIQIYYNADFVQRIALQSDGVRIDYLERNVTGEGRSSRQFIHRRPPEDPQDPVKFNVQRRNGLLDYRSRPVDEALELGSSDPLPIIVGGTLLVDELERPYRFIVDIRRTFSEDAEAKELWQKVCAILDAEKPAHTEYAVRFTPAAERPGLRFMQIGERSSIGLDTTVA
jgi:phage tail-like protein